MSRPRFSALSPKTSLCAIAILALGSCSNSKDVKATDSVDSGLTERVWEFDDVEGWEYYHQDTATVTQWKLDDGKLALSTRAYTYDRTKMHTADRTHADGVYRWRTYVPAIGQGEQVSIGSWIYSDDHHELDFEVGPGTSEARKQANAADDELLACMTNQDHPYFSGYTPIKPGWHDFEIRLDLTPDTTYMAIWSIDGEEKQRLPLEFGPEIGFTVQCSVENLKFIGDTISTADYTALYDRVSFNGHLTTHYGK